MQKNARMYAEENLGITELVKNYQIHLIVY